LILEAAIILVLILVLVCILVVPFDIALNLNIDGFKTRGYFKLTWMKIRLLQNEFPGAQKKIEKKEKKDREQKFDIKRLPRIISLLYESSPYLMRIFNAFLKSITFKRFYLKLILGSGSPYDTAVISGYLYALMPLLNLIPKTCFFFFPDFRKERFEASVNLEIRIRLLWIMIESLRAVIKKPVRSLLNEFRKVR